MGSEFFSVKVIPPTDVVPKNIDGLGLETSKKVEHKRFRLGHVEVSPNPVGWNLMTVLKPSSLGTTGRSVASN